MEWGIYMHMGNGILRERPTGAGGGSGMCVGLSTKLSHYFNTRRHLAADDDGDASVVGLRDLIYERCFVCIISL